MKITNEYIQKEVLAYAKIIQQAIKQQKQTEQKKIQQSNIEIQDINQLIANCWAEIKKLLLQVNI